MVWDCLRHQREMEAKLRRLRRPEDDALWAKFRERREARRVEEVRKRYPPGFIRTTPFEKIEDSPTSPTNEETKS